MNWARTKRENAFGATYIEHACGVWVIREFTNPKSCSLRINGGLVLARKNFKLREAKSLARALEAAIAGYDYD